MKKMKNFSLLLLGISIVGYLLAVVCFHGAYDEVIGETIIFGKALTVHRSWRECLMCIGCSLLFMFFVNVVAFIINLGTPVGNGACEEIDLYEEEALYEESDLYDEIDLCEECDLYEESDLYAECSTASRGIGSYMKRAVVEALQFFLGVLVLLVEGVMFGALLLGKCHNTGRGEMILLLSCIAMTIYAMVEVALATRKELSFFISNISHR